YPTPGVSSAQLSWPALPGEELHGATISPLPSAADRPVLAAEFLLRRRSRQSLLERIAEQLLVRRAPQCRVPARPISRGSDSCSQHLQVGSAALAGESQDL